MPLDVRAADAADTAWQRQSAAWPGNNTHAVWPAARARRARSSSLFCAGLHRNLVRLAAWPVCGLHVCARALSIVTYSGLCRPGWVS